MLNCNTSTSRIPRLLTSVYKTLKIDIRAVPTKTTVERMALELGVLSDHISSEVLCATENCTLAFDASTQGGVHFNVLYLSTPTPTYTLAVDELPGGTAEDYSEHMLLLSTHSSLIIGGSPLLLSDGGSPPASPASHLAGLLRRRDPSTNPGPIAWWVSVGN